MAKASVLIRFTIDHLDTDEQAKAEGFAGFADAVRFLIEEDGLFGMVDDDFEIVEIREIDGAEER